MTATVIPLRESLDPMDQGAAGERERHRQRYRILAFWPDGEVKEWPQSSPPEVGSALCTLSEEGEFDGAAVGVLDTKGLPRGSGVWIVNPYASARS